MKKNKIALAIIPFFIGIAFGISLFALLSFSRTDDPPDPQTLTITMPVDNANFLYKNYISTASVVSTPIKGFNVDLQQLDAMNRLVRENPSLAGFRIYLGRDGSKNQVGIVVGVDSQGLDAASKNIYRTVSPSSGTCPFVCDRSSPITSD